MGWFSAMYVPWSRNASGGWLAGYVCMYVCSLLGFQFSGELAWLGGWLLKICGWEWCWFGGFFWVCLGGGFGEVGGGLVEMDGICWLFVLVVLCGWIGLGCVNDVVV